jgi:PPOX class probable F420-dependent enzyme
MPDGSPQVSPVWIDFDGVNVIFNTAVGRVKERNLRRDPRVAIALADPENLYRYVQVRGTAELVVEDAEDHIDRLSLKYRGRPFAKRPGERRVKVVVRPRAVQWMG